MTQKFIDENEKTRILDLINKTQERLRSMGPKLAYLQQKCADAQSVCDQWDRKYRELEEEYRSIQADLDAHAQSMPRTVFSSSVLPFSSYSIRCLQRRLEKIKDERGDLARQMQNALNDKGACDDEYAEYKQKYDGFIQTQQECEARYRSIETANAIVAENQDETSCGCENESDCRDMPETDVADAEKPQGNDEMIVGSDSVSADIVIEEECTEAITEETSEIVADLKENIEKSFEECNTVEAEEHNDVDAESAAEDEVVESVSFDSKDSLQDELLSEAEVEQQGRKSESGFFGFRKNKPQT